MTNPDYKIQELFDVDRMCRYYVVLKRALIPIDMEYHTIKKFDELEKAKECVRQLRKYKEPVYHYVED
jgi:hypothetical protein